MPPRDGTGETSPTTGPVSVGLADYPGISWSGERSGWLTGSPSSAACMPGQ